MRSEQGDLLADGSSAATIDEWRDFVDGEAAVNGIGKLGLALVDGHRSVAVDSGGTLSLYQAASSAKHITARLLLELSRTGQLNLNDPIEAYVDGLPAGWGSRTIFSLLHHTSGLPDYLAGVTGAAPATAAEFLDLCSALPSAEPEGAGWRYSNTNYILAGMAAKNAGQRPCGDQMQALLSRAGATGARVAAPSWVREVNAGERSFSESDRASLSREVIGDGDVAFTALSAIAWLRGMVEPSNPDAAAQFAPAPLNDGAPAPYGAGLFLEQMGAARLAHHAGHFDGWTAMILLNLDRRAGVFAFCDSAPGNSRTIRSIAVRALERFAPGATPLSLPGVTDDDAGLSQRVLAQLIRPDGPRDLSCFTASMHPVPGARDTLSFWTGVHPQTIDLVSVHDEQGRQMRRYRLTYSERTEHLSVGVADGGRIDWAWTL